jgi:hypothetical protein
LQRNPPPPLPPLDIAHRLWRRTQAVAASGLVEERSAFKPRTERRDLGAGTAFAGQ